MRVLELLTWTEIATALNARVHGKPSSMARGASIDTRTLEPGDLFFALKGERVDGHQHLAAAYLKGASGAVVTDPAHVPTGAFALEVKDAEHALFELSRMIRSRSTALFVAITGSAGKTTAKEFTAELLGDRGPVLATRGNLNNHLGVPLTLSRLEVEHWAAVIECGMSHPGEISRLAHLVQPTVAAITNVAAAHLEYFASVNEIAAAKAEIFETLGPGNTAVAPANEPLLTQPALATKASVRLFGEGAQSSVRAIHVAMTIEGSTFELEASGEKVAVSLPVPGPHAIANFLLAAAIAGALGISNEAIASRALHLKAGGNRGAVKRLRDDILLIDDSYNSNPMALLSAVETLALAKNRRLVACIGDMLELGPKGPSLHRDAGAVIAPQIDLLLGVGPLGAEVVAGAASLPEHSRKSFSDSKELAERITSFVQARDAVLVKGSRGVRMERVVEALVTAHPEVAA